MLRRGCGRRVQIGKPQRKRTWLVHRHNNVLKKEAGAGGEGDRHRDLRGGIDAGVGDQPSRRGCGKLRCTRHILGVHGGVGLPQPRPTAGVGTLLLLCDGAEMRHGAERRVAQQPGKHNIHCCQRTIGAQQYTISASQPPHESAVCHAVVLAQARVAKTNGPSEKEGVDGV